MTAAASSLTSLSSLFDDILSQIRQEETFSLSPTMYNTSITRVLSRHKSFPFKPALNLIKLVHKSVCVSMHTLPYFLD